VAPVASPDRKRIAGVPIGRDGQGLGFLHGDKRVNRQPCHVDGIYEVSRTPMDQMGGEILSEGHDEARVMGKIIRFISEAAPKFQTDWRSLDVSFTGIYPIDICCPRCGCRGDGRTRQTEVKNDRR